MLGKINSCIKWNQTEALCNGLGLSHRCEATPAVNYFTCIAPDEAVARTELCPLFSQQENPHCRFLSFLCLSQSLESLRVFGEATAGRPVSDSLLHILTRTFPSLISVLREQVTAAACHRLLPAFQPYLFPLSASVPISCQQSAIADIFLS